jgi:hypothetical protein
MTEDEWVFLAIEDVVEDVRMGQGPRSPHIDRARYYDPILFEAEILVFSAIMILPELAEEFVPDDWPITLITDHPEREAINAELKKMGEELKQQFPVVVHPTGVKNLIQRVFEELPTYEPGLGAFDKSFRDLLKESEVLGCPSRQLAVVVLGGRVVAVIAETRAEEYSSADGVVVRDKSNTQIGRADGGDDVRGLRGGKGVRGRKKNVPKSGTQEEPRVGGKRGGKSRDG